MISTTEIKRRSGSQSEKIVNESNTPLVTIGLPTYNRAKLLEKSLNTLLAQTYANIEVIVSDNHSTDGTSALMGEMVKKDSRIHYFRQDQPLTAIANAHFTLEKAKGEYFFGRLMMIYGIRNL
jgi:glycosyltransferase involved in cell wall biosynthesis